MRGAFAATILFVLGLVHMAPLAVLVQFHADRAYIERELCVQREVMEEMRTCHGECQLSKRFRTLEHKAGQSFPTERIEHRFEPKVPLTADHAWFANGPFTVLHPEVVMEPLEQILATAEPVPWA